MSRVCRAGDHGCDTLVGDEILEKELRPAAGEILRPVGKGFVVHRAEEAAAAERQRGEHAGLDLGRKRKDALLRLSISDRVVDLHEVGFFARDHRFHGGKIAVERRGDADVATDALRLPFLELRQWRGLRTLWSCSRSSFAVFRRESERLSSAASGASSLVAINTFSRKPSLPS